MTRHVLWLGGAVSALMATTALAEDLVYSHVMSSSHPDVAQVIPAYAAAVAAATGDAYVFDIHPGGALAAAGVHLDAIADGTIDLGFGNYGYAPALVPALALLGDLPVGIVQVAAAASTETMLLDCPQCLADFDSAGIKILFNNTTEPYTYFCAKPVTRPEDTAGIRVRATGGFAQISAAIGMTPANISFSEMYEAMQRGQVECTVLGVASFDSVGMWDVAKYAMPDLPIGASHGWTVLAINGEVWDGFDAPTRAAFIAAAPQAIVDQARNSLDVAREAFLRGEAAGVEMLAPTPELVAVVDAAMIGQAEGAVAAARDRGVENPEAIAAAFAENVAKWTAIYDEIGGEGEWTPAQWDAFRDKLQSEIYANLPADF